MDYLSLILLAVGLSMDSFAVAIGRGSRQTPTG
jgi:putative Mn2+ efflux pump MntP